MSMLEPTGCRCLCHDVEGDTNIEGGCKVCEAIHLEPKPSPIAPVAETLRASIQALTDEIAGKDTPTRMLSPLWVQIELRKALAKPDDPRDAKLRAFADSMTPEKWAEMKDALNMSRLMWWSRGSQSRSDCVAEIAASVEKLSHE